MAAEEAARRAGEHGIRKLDVIVSGTGSGRDTAPIRQIERDPDMVGHYLVVGDG